MIQGVLFCSEGEVKKCVKAVVIMLLDFFRLSTGSGEHKGRHWTLSSKVMSSETVNW